MKFDVTREPSSTTYDVRLNWRTKDKLVLWTTGAVITAASVLVVLALDHNLNKTDSEDSE